VEQGHLWDDLFQPSNAQLEAWVEVIEAAGELAGLAPKKLFSADQGTEEDQQTYLQK
jgi:hypothetical protein